MRQWTKLFTGILALSSFHALADGEALLPEDKIQTRHNMIRLLNRADLKLDRFFLQNGEFCEQFLTDLRAQSEISYVEPILQTDSFEDPAWETYKKKCPDLYLDLDGGHVATRKFTLFHVNIDNDASNGKEFVFYAERYLNELIQQNVREGRWRSKPGVKVVPDPRRVGFKSGGYTVVDFERCRVKGGKYTADPYDYYLDRPLNNFSEILLYKGEAYIFSMQDLSKGRDEQFAVDLYKYDINKERMVPYCYYDEYREVHPDNAEKK